MRRVLLAGLALLLASALAAADGPTYSLGRDGTLVLSALPDILSRPEVRPHLTSGLTTSFVVVATATGEIGPKARGAGRIDVRWELWDEVFLVSAVGADGRVQKDSLPSLERLAAWWRRLELPVATHLPSGRWDVKVELSVLPFSQSEQRDAQRWFSKTVGPEAAGEAPREAPGAAEGGVRLGGVMDLLMATSIQRRSLVRYVWPAVPRPAAERR